MGTLDSQGSNTKRTIKFVDITGFNATQLENAYNSNYGKKGWRIIQVLEISNKRYIVAEKEE